MDKQDVVGFLEGLLTYVADGNVVELHPCGFVDEVKGKVAQLKKELGYKTFDVMLTTLDCSPAYSAKAVVEAKDIEEAKSLALSMDYDDLEWTDDLGRSKSWQQIDSDEVTTAE